MSQHYIWYFRCLLCSKLCEQELEVSFIHTPNKLQQRFILVGVANFVLMPFTLIFMIVYFFMRNAEALHNNKEYLGPREWSPYVDPFQFWVPYFPT